MLNKIFTIFVVLFMFAGLFSARGNADTQKIEIVTTLFPTYDFVRQVGKDKVNVTLLLPPGVEAHTFQPKPADIVRINKADIFIYTGKFFEPWVESLIKGVSNKNLVIIDASQGIQLLENNNDGENGESIGHTEHGEQDECFHKHLGKDPHIWLDLDNARVMVDTIAKGLAEKDQSNSGYYLNNAKEYNALLAELDARFKSTLSACKYKTIIYGGHFTFGYFAKRYGLTYISPYDGFSPNAEPSPKAIAELIKKLRAVGMKCVYYEELLDPKVSRIIADETGAKILLLHGAHNVSKDDFKKGVTFLDIMEDNLKNLKDGLECE
ncbi:periplasmic solute-binding protein [Candidatus Omnitrophus magneticus]|uniref:Periplasmic solute-binding protein n=1 Tax=Candidatus Omnitrophus magneticus TaxID=1609969 RepID=A0A0F0CU86_9BACT|nr:periplasmic solute-binding protein [Candidatus Omnitrophus magneticus]